MRGFDAIILLVQVITPSYVRLMSLFVEARWLGTLPHKFGNEQFHLFVGCHSDRFSNDLKTILKQHWFIIRMPINCVSAGA